MIRFSVSRWAAWAPGVEDPRAWQQWANGERAIGAGGQPTLATLDPMLRRRAGLLGRLALEPLLAVGAPALPIVFCSRHGEALRGIELLRTLGRGEPLSPTEFSLSVHNATSGLHAIAHASHAPLIAMAAGPASAAHGLIEACAQLDAGAAEVALAVYDAPLPEPYDRYRDEAEFAYGWAWVLQPPAASHFGLEWRHDDTAVDEARGEPFGLALLRAFLAGDSRELPCVDGTRWRWHA